MSAVEPKAQKEKENDHIIPQPPPARLHPDRAARRDRHHRDSRRHPLPRLRQSPRKGPRSITCVSNEKQIGLGVIQYVQDNDEMYIPIAGGATARWTMLVYPYVKSYGVYQCPDDPGINDMTGIYGDRESYGMNIKLSLYNGVTYTGIALAAINNPSDLCMLVEDYLTVVPGQSEGYNGTGSAGGTESVTRTPGTAASSGRVSHASR